MRMAKLVIHQKHVSITAAKSLRTAYDMRNANGYTCLRAWIDDKQRNAKH